MGKWQPHSSPCAAAVVAICLLSLFVQHADAVKWPLINSREGNVLTLILTDCAKYQDWQTIAAAFAWRHSPQGGSMVRIANCNPDDTKSYDKKMLEYVQTQMVPQHAWNEELKDWYAAYNKPGAVVEYFKHNKPKEEWVVVLDSDMLLHKAFDPKDLPLERGWAYAGHYDYLIGTDNALALRHVPEISPRNDTKAGRVGRRGDRVGGPYFMHRDDLSKLAPQWLNYTKIMRTDMEAYKDSGDTASKKGDRIWIAEMYGYSFGAAKSNVWHTWREDFMLYPTYTPGAIPYIIHYGLIYHVNNWTFDKHFYFDFDSHKCTPWDLNTDRPKAGIFPAPPAPDTLTGDYINRYKDLIAVSVITTVNAALCDYHVRNCPPSAQLTKVCNEAFKLYRDVAQAIKDVEWDYECTNHNKDCKTWADRGECQKMRAYMHDHCRAACGACKPKGPRPKTDQDELITVEALSTDIGKTAVPASAVRGTGHATNTTAQQPPAQPSSQVPAQATKPVDAAKTPAKQQPPPADDEADMRRRFRQSTLGFAALIKRCLDLQGLSEKESRDCVKAASFKLEYPGSLKPEAELAAAAAGAAKTVAGAASDAAKAAGGAAADTAKAAADAAGGALKKVNGAAAATHDLASLHAQRFHVKYEELQGQLGRRMTGPSGGWSFIEQSCVVMIVVGILYVSFSRLIQYRKARAKQHGRSD